MGMDHFCTTKESFAGLSETGEDDEVTPRFKGPLRPLRAVLGWRPRLWGYHRLPAGIEIWSERYPAGSRWAASFECRGVTFTFGAGGFKRGLGNVSVIERWSFEAWAGRTYLVVDQLALLGASPA